MSAESIPRELATERLLLRRWRSTDLEGFAAINADPAVMEHIGEPLTRPQSDAFVARIERQFDDVGYGLWALEVRETGELVGYTGLAVTGHSAPSTSAIEVGWRLAREAWGLGYATEAATAALDLGFGALALPEVVSITTRGNLRSQAVMRRLGMNRAPDLDFERERLRPGDPLRVAIVHRLGRDDWQARS